VTAAAIQLIGCTITSESVIAGIAMQLISSTASMQGITPIATKQLIVIRSTIEIILTGPAVDHVGSFLTLDVVSAVIAEQHI